MKEQIHKHKLVAEDKALFESMEGHYQSDNECEFFEKQRYKQENIITIFNDLLLHEDNNEDRIYIVRCWYEEYVVGGELYKQGEEHFMTLCETLNANLKEIGVLDRDITLFQWLRERAYKGVEYDHNYDDL